MRLQIDNHPPQPLGTLLRPRACVIAVLTAISILLSPAAAVAEETADQARRAQVFEEAISTSIRASAARELAAARAQAEQELRSLTTLSRCATRAGAEGERGTVRQRVPRPRAACWQSGTRGVIRAEFPPS